jgi:predicted glycosyltransferase
LVGHALPIEVFDDLRAMAPENVVVERARPDFTCLLQGCHLSISQAGYNTVMEVLDAGVPAVVAPYAGGLESEQTLRAKRLAARGVLQVVDEQALNAATIAAAIERALAAPPSRLGGLDTGGAERTPGLLREALAERREKNRTGAARAC